MKIIDKINHVLEEDQSNKKTFYSFEYFPARTEQGNSKSWSLYM